MNDSLLRQILNSKVGFKLFFLAAMLSILFPILSFFYGGYFQYIVGTFCFLYVIFCVSMAPEIDNISSWKTIVFYIVFSSLIVWNFESISRIISARERDFFMGAFYFFILFSVLRLLGKEIRKRSPKISDKIIGIK